MHRFSAKLLFQYAVIVGGETGKRRICEERIVVFEAKTAAAALRTAQSRGRTSQTRFENEDGNEVFFEFLGVRELLHLGPECGDDEVWYEVKEYLTPKERLAVLIPDPDKLQAIQEFNARRHRRR